MPLAVATGSLPVQFLLGVYLGLLTGILPALVSWALAVLFRYVTGLTVPSFAVVVLGVAMAGVNGGFMAFNDPQILRSTNNVTLVTAVLVVMMVSFYAHNQGDKLGAVLPKRVSLRSLRDRTPAADVVEFVGGRGQVRVRVVGSVDDLEGYPPLPEDLRREVGAVEWAFPADLSLSELEAQFADRLRSEFDLADVAVTVDEQARATVDAAPPASGVSGRLPPGTRAVSVSALVPTGLARGDEVVVRTPDGAIEGTLVSARSHDGGKPAASEPADADADPGPDPPPRAPTTTGGEGRATVAVDADEAEALVGTSEACLVVGARGTRREYELVALLRRAGQRVRRCAVSAGGALDGTTIGAANVRAAYGVAILAVRRDGRWLFAPDGTVRLSAGDDLFVVGSRAALGALDGVVE